MAQSWHIISSFIRFCQEKTGIAPWGPGFRGDAYPGAVSRLRGDAEDRQPTLAAGEGSSLKKRAAISFVMAICLAGAI
jgi:hypothetical protein